MRRDVRGELEGAVPNELIPLIPRSFDVIGSKGRGVAIIEVPQELIPYEKLIAEAMMRVHGNVKSVLSKTSERTGDFRVRGMKLIGGDPNTEIVHKESGCAFKLDPLKVYFSPRESTERDRISARVMPGERVLVMFSGVGPFAICIAKRQPTATCVAVELNPDAHRYSLENIVLNKVANRVTPLLGDVNLICPRLGEVFDRVLMPLPKGAYGFLDVAVDMVKPGGILHFYHWAPKDDPFSDGIRLVKLAALDKGRAFEVLDLGLVSQYSPSAWKIRVDAIIH